jgi:hypothetical protein
MAGMTGLTVVLLISCGDPVKSEPSSTVGVAVVNPNTNTVERTVPTQMPPSGLAAVPNTAGIAVITVAADYTAANFEIVSTTGYSVSRNIISGLYTDLSIKAYGDDVFILERFGKDNVVKYNAREKAVVYQESLGEGVNIQDIAVISETKAYISCLQNKDLIVFDPSAGAKTSTIDLSRFNTYAGTDSAEAYPYASALAVYGDYLYIACQRLNSSFEPADTSLIAVIDTRTDEVAGSIKLNKKNPASMDVFGDRLLVSSSGDWFDPATSGVEMIDLTNNQNLGLIADGSAFGGSLGKAIFVSQNKAYATVTVGWPNNHIIEFNPQTKAIGKKISGISDGSGGLAYDGSKLYVGRKDFIPE